MPVHLSPPLAEKLLPIAGVRIGVVQAGIRKAGRKDVTLMLIEPGASVGGVFTQNRFCAAPVQVCREHLATGHGVRAIVINTGNANAGTGEDGLMRARATCIAVARALEVAPEQVLPLSTGVIMEPLPHQRIIDAVPAAIAHANEQAWFDAAEGDQPSNSNRGSHGHHHRHVQRGRHDSPEHGHHAGVLGHRCGHRARAHARSGP